MTTKTTRTRRPSAARARAAAETEIVPHELSPAELDLAHEATASTVETSEATTDALEPTMSPPGTTLGTAAKAAGATISGQRIVALWAEQSNRNSWAYLETAGWKKLSPLTDTGSTTMTMLAAHARATGSAPYVDENPAGTLSVMYVW